MTTACNTYSIHQSHNMLYNIYAYQIESKSNSDIHRNKRPFRRVDLIN